MIIDRLPGSLSFYLLIVLAIVADTPFFTLVAPAGAARREWPAVVSASVCFTFAISVNWSGVGGATLVQVVAVLVAAALFRRPLARTVFDAGRYGLAMFAAGGVFVAAHHPVGIANDPHTDGLIVAGALAWFGVFHLLTAVEERLRAGTGWWPALCRHAGEEALSAAAMLMLGVMVVGLVRGDGWLLVFTLVPLFAVGRMIRLSYQRVRLARLDPVTGLSNRSALAAEVDRRLSTRGGRTGEPRTGEPRTDEPRTGEPRIDQRRTGDGGAAPRFALLLADLDRFADINAALGHVAGDRVLAAVASRLKRTAPERASVGRLGADQFAVFTPIADEANLAQCAAGIAAALAGPLDVDRVPLHVSASIGAAVHPHDGTDFATLLRHADTAVHEAKRQGRTVVRYQPGSAPDDASRLTLLADLRCALDMPESAQIEPHFQPQVDLRTGRPVAVEALLRWRHPRRGPVPPDLVIAVAEPTDLMYPLTQRVIVRTLHELARWRARGVAVRGSVNVSVRDLYQLDFAAWLVERLRESGVPPEQLMLEITETALMADPDRVRPSLLRLHGTGVGLSLDDFGTGYSSLAHLRRLPVTEVKIDRSFVATATRDPADEALVHSIIGLASTLGLRVVAEGVENEATRQLLLADGCHTGQGWYYAPAMPADQVVEWIIDRRDTAHDQYHPPA